MKSQWWNRKNFMKKSKIIKLKIWKRHSNKKNKELWKINEKNKQWKFMQIMRKKFNIQILRE